VVCVWSKCECGVCDVCGSSVMCLCWLCFSGEPDYRTQVRMPI
jgi:hypothetical protein